MTLEQHEISTAFDWRSSHTVCPEEGIWRTLHLKLHFVRRCAETLHPGEIIWSAGVWTLTIWSPSFGRTCRSVFAIILETDSATLPNTAQSVHFLPLFYMKRPVRWLVHKAGSFVRVKLDQFLIFPLSFWLFIYLLLDLKNNKCFSTYHQEYLEFKIHIVQL